MKTSEQIARLERRVGELEAHRLQDGADVAQAVASCETSDHERNWLLVYTQVLGGLIAARRAMTDELVAPLEGVAASAATRACGPRKAEPHG